MNKDFLALVLCSFFCIFPAHAVNLIVIDGELQGASNIWIGGVLYDVEFVDGTCAELFSGCDDNSDFAFDIAGATLAAQVLLDEVFIDTPEGAFDSNPQLTAGCEISLCVTFVPANISASLGVYGMRARNSSSEFLDDVDLSRPFLEWVDTSDLNTGGSDNFARWTSVSPVPGLACDIQLNDELPFTNGDTVTAEVIRLTNLGKDPVAIEIKIWLGLSSLPPISVTNVGSDGSLVLPAGTDIDLGPLPLFSFDPAFPRGGYEFSCRMLDPVTGELLSEDRNFFEILPFAIGDTGPAGGIVFYVTDGGAHGLEVAPTDLANAEWGCEGTLISGADGIAIGTGAQNTVDILAECAEPGIAAALADAYTLNGFSDWFLPSQDELNELYLNKDVVGGFVVNTYWSSSEYDVDNAWYQGFATGLRAAFGKNYVARYVRAIRAF